MPSAGTLGESEVFTKPLLVRSNYEGKLLSEVIGTFECRDEYDAAYLYVFVLTNRVPHLKEYVLWDKSYVSNVAFYERYSSPNMR